MALKAAPILVYCGNNKKNTPYPQLGISDFVGGRPAFLHLRIQREWECLSHRAITPVEDEIPSAPVVVEEATQITLAAGGFHKDLNSLPKPLSATDFSSSSSDGKKVRVAYQGVPGAYSEAAALKAYPMCETVPCDQFEAAFKAVELWLADKAVLPIENSVGGSIHRNYDLLLRHRLHIVGEVQMSVNHCLLGLPGVRKEELKRVLSHPQALDQCETTLNELGVTRVTADDTAIAAQIVASEGVRETGAVASARAAEIYGLDVLSERIQDDSDNVTRFLILAREPIIPGTDRPYKTSIVFSLEEGPGILFKALAVFALRGINLSKIESRPQKRRPLRVVDDSNRGSATFYGGASCSICAGTSSGVCDVSSSPWLLSDGYSSMNKYAGILSSCIQLDSQPGRKELVKFHLFTVLLKQSSGEDFVDLVRALHTCDCCIRQAFHSIFSILSPTNRAVGAMLNLGTQN